MREWTLCIDASMNGPLYTPTVISTVIGAPIHRDGTDPREHVEVHAVADCAERERAMRERLTQAIGLLAMLHELDGGWGKPSEQVRAFLDSQGVEP